MQRILHPYASVVRSTTTTTTTTITGLEPRPTCDAPLATPPRRCTIPEVQAFEDRWMREVDAAKFNQTPCPQQQPHHSSSRRRPRRGWCNQTGNMHGGGIYPDNGSAGWRVFANVLSEVFHSFFVWDSQKMQNMSFVGSWTDSLLFTNNAARHGVRVAGNVYVDLAGGDVWPPEALVVIHGAGAGGGGGGNGEEERSALGEAGA